MDYVVNAKNRPLGRVASEVAVILQGKKSPRFERHVVGADRAIVKNYQSIVMTGGKEKKKVYYRHTGYMGHLKRLTFEQAFARNPKTVFREAVRRMLPKNFLNSKRLNNLIFSDES